MAAQVTGPAKHPLPASSAPASSVNPEKLDFNILREYDVKVKKLCRTLKKT